MHLTVGAATQWDLARWRKESTRALQNSNRSNELILRRKNLAKPESMTDRLGNSSAEKALKDTEVVMKLVCILAAMKANGILD